MGLKMFGVFQCHMTWDLGEGDEDSSSFDLYHDSDEEEEDTDNDMADGLIDCSNGLECGSPRGCGRHRRGVRHEGDDGFSSGISEAGTDANCDQEHDGDEDSEALRDPDSDHQIVSSGARPALGKIKVYYLSPEWKELQRLSPKGWH